MFPSLSHLTGQHCLESAQDLISKKEKEKKTIQK
jgi:hypothetical protein